MTQLEIVLVVHPTSIFEKLAHSQALIQLLAPKLKLETAKFTIDQMSRGMVVDSAGISHLIELWAKKVRYAKHLEFGLQVHHDGIAHRRIWKTSGDRREWEPSVETRHPNLLFGRKFYTDVGELAFG